jgi:hypothetical protein
MSVLELPEPAGWRGGRTFLKVAIAGSAVVAGVYSYLGVAAATRGSFLTTAVTIGWAIFLLTFVVAMLLVACGRTNARTTSDATGFTVWPDGRFSAVMLIGVVAAVPSCLVFAVSAPFGAIEFANTRMSQSVLPVAAAFVAFTGISGLITAWRRGGVGHVKLTPAMIENADILKTRLFEWEDVVDVADHAESKKARRAVVLRLRDGHEEIISVADIYLPRGVALYWLVRHYWRHPEDRTELVDARASERLRDGRFDLA